MVTGAWSAPQPTHGDFAGGLVALVMEGRSLWVMIRLHGRWSDSALLLRLWRVKSKDSNGTPGFGLGGAMPSLDRPPNFPEFLQAPSKIGDFVPAR
jgi:hypothetical protein